MHPLSPFAWSNVQIPMDDENKRENDEANGLGNIPNRGKYERKHETETTRLPWCGASIYQSCCIFFFF
jgi:hypothetical protein